MIIDKFYWREPTKVIPTIFDDSLSYYELICKILKKLNESIDILNDHTAKFAQYDEQFEEVNELVAEVNEKLTQFEDDVETAVEQAGEAKALSEQLAGQIGGILESITSILSRVSSLEAVTSVLDDDIAVLQATVAGLATNKQDKLVSGTNIKTINNQSILGSGNLDVSGGGGGGMVDDVKVDGTSVVSNRVANISLSGKLDANKNAISTAGGLVVPTTAPSATALVAVETDREQAQVEIGDTLKLDNSTSPYELNVDIDELWGNKITADDQLKIYKYYSNWRIGWNVAMGDNMTLEQSGGSSSPTLKCAAARKFYYTGGDTDGSTITLDSANLADLREAFNKNGVVQLINSEVLSKERVFTLGRLNYNGYWSFYSVEYMPNGSVLFLVISFLADEDEESITQGTLHVKTIS